MLRGQDAENTVDRGENGCGPQGGRTDLPNAPHIYSDEWVQVWKEASETNSRALFLLTNLPCRPLMLSMRKVHTSTSSRLPWDLAADGTDFKVVGPSAIPITGSDQIPHPLTREEMLNYMSRRPKISRGSRWV